MIVTESKVVKTIKRETKDYSVLVYYTKGQQMVHSLHNTFDQAETTAERLMHEQAGIVAIEIKENVYTYK